jgi:hypothetical protein
MPAKCTTGEVAALKEQKDVVGSGRIACPETPDYSLSTNQGHDTMMDCQLTNLGAYLVAGTHFTDGIGAKRANDPTRQIAVTHSLDQSHEGLRPLRVVQTGFKHPPTQLPTLVPCVKCHPPVDLRETLSRA